MFTLETFLVVNKDKFQLICPNYVSVPTEFLGVSYVKMSDEMEIKKISQLDRLDSLYLNMSIVFKWNDEILLDTTIYELNMWESLIEAAEALSKESSCKVRLGIDTVMLSVEETLQGEVNWSVRDQFDTSDIYFDAKIPDKKLLVTTIINGAIEFYSTLNNYGFQNKKFIDYCLRRLVNIKI
jgi:hypothetical protein